MARPSREELDKRLKIIRTGIVKRTNSVYIDFERKIEEEPLQNRKIKAPYYFSLLCESRKSNAALPTEYMRHQKRELLITLVQVSTIFTNDTFPMPLSEYAKLSNHLEQNSLDHINKNNYIKELNKILQDLNQPSLSLKSINDENLNQAIQHYFSYENLFKIDSYLGGYFYNVFKTTRRICDSGKPINRYVLMNIVDSSLMYKAFGNRAYELIDEYECLEDMILPKEDLDKTPKLNSSKEKLKLFNAIYKESVGNLAKPYKTIIEKPSNSEITRTTVSKSAFLELDFSKPLEDIIQTVKEVKGKIENDPEFFKTPYELLGGEPLQVFKTNLKTDEIYKETRSPKPIEGRLADMLFIYDCKKANLTNDYIIESINDYWNDVKNIVDTEAISLDTVQRYYKTAQEYIDLQKYKKFISGVENIPDFI